MDKFTFITDLHVAGVANNRTGDYLTDICDKLKWVVDHCNREDRTLLIGGDLFDRAIVADSVKSAVASVLTQLKVKAVTIMGNHDRCYESDDQNYKTSYNVLAACGCIRDIDGYSYRSGNVMISNQEVFFDDAMPEIKMYHGFLNQEDGRNTFRSEWIRGTNKLILLGHDHKKYPDLEVTPGVVVIRPGSFARQGRTEESYRQPEIVDITWDGERFITEYKEIEAARHYDTIFKTKLESYKSTGSITYLDLLMSLNEVSVDSEDLVDILKDCASCQVIELVKELLARKILKK